MLEGRAEVFGAELLAGLPQVFRDDAKLAVFSWTGATVRLSGHWQHAYVSAETPMRDFLDAHEELERRRAAAARSGSAEAFGPRVVVCGATDSGKSSLCRILLNYALKRGWKPLQVDVDVGQNGITIPGCVAATTLEHPLSSAQGAQDGRQPVAFFLGDESPQNKMDLYRRLVSKLGQVVRHRMRVHEPTRHAGFVANTCGWVDGAGYQMLVKDIVSLEADVVYVLDMERLKVQLSEEPELKERKVFVRLLRKSAGTVTRDAKFRQAARARAIHDYFYGPWNTLSPHSKAMMQRDMKCFKVCPASARVRASCAEPSSLRCRLVAFPRRRSMLCRSAPSRATRWSPARRSPRACKSSRSPTPPTLRGSSSSMSPDSCTSPTCANRL